MLDAVGQTVVEAQPNRMWGEDGSTPTPSGRYSAWCVAATYPQAERRAEASLQQRGYRTYLPLITVRKRDRVVRTLWHTVEVPAFTGYLFVHLDPRDPWLPARHAPGVFDFIRDGSGLKPQPCRCGVVEALREAADARSSSLPQDTGWRPGEGCIVDAGAFCDVPAVVTQVGKEMVLVTMLMFGELRECLVSLDCLRKRDE